MDTNQRPSEGEASTAVADATNRDVVTITVNNTVVRIHRGRRSVAEIKAAGHVPLADDLEQIVNCQLIPLQDDGHVVIKGDEVFVSHPKSTSSS